MQGFAIRAAFAIAGLVPVTAGLWGIVAALGGPAGSLMNHGRYLSGLLLGIGLAFWASVRDIEHHTARIRLLVAIVMLGGACRLVGILLGDPLSPSVMGALVMELGVTPLLCLWQARFALPARAAE